MPAVVLDSYALLAFLRGEAGAGHVAGLLEAAAVHDTPVHMTEVNYAEVKYVVMRKDGAAQWAVIARELPAVPIAFHPADRRLSDLAGDFKARFKLSLADAFAAALAKEKKAQLVTADREFKSVESEIKIVWLE